MGRRNKTENAETQKASDARSDEETTNENTTKGDEMELVRPWLCTSTERQSASAPHPLVKRLGCTYKLEHLWQ